MKARVALALVVLGLAAVSCTSYKTCATYSKNTAPVVEKPQQVRI